MIRLKPIRPQPTYSPSERAVLKHIATATMARYADDTAIVTALEAFMADMPTVSGINMNFTGILRRNGRVVSGVGYVFSDLPRPIADGYYWRRLCRRANAAKGQSGITRYGQGERVGESLINDELGVRSLYESWREALVSADQNNAQGSFDMCLKDDPDE